MKKVVFFTERKWAFGSIHQGAAKLLYNHNILAELLDWDTEYSPEEFKYIDENTDLFVTTPVGVQWLLARNIHPRKIASVAHGQWDILLAKQQMGLDIYNHLWKFGVISPILKQKAAEFGVPVEAHLTPLGIHYDRYYMEPANCLESVGYGGAFHTHNFAGEEIKRGYLVQEAAKQAGLPMIMHGFFHYLAVPAYYKKIGCVMMSSCEEAGGLPMMEAAAAGRLTLGTPVGYYEYNGEASGGVVLPIDQEQYVKQASEALIHYKNNPADYQETCLKIQQYARRYDWSCVIDQWVDFLK